MTYIVGKDPWMQHAIEIIKADHGVDVSLAAKNEDLLKYGRSSQVQTSLTSLMTLPTGTFNETYVSSNLINSIISTSTSDNTTVTIEGHTISGTDLTFVSQTVTLNGRTKVDLTTALARVTNAFASGGTDLVGRISVTETDTYTNGVPDTPSKVHLQILAGSNRSEKSSASTSSGDFWVVSSVYGDIQTKAASSAEIRLETRAPGKVFMKVADFSVSKNHSRTIDFRPYLIIPPNYDIRLRSLAGTNGRDVSGGIIGALLKSAP